MKDDPEVPQEIHKTSTRKKGSWISLALVRVLFFAVIAGFKTESRAWNADAVCQNHQVNVWLLSEPWDFSTDTSLFLPAWEVAATSAPASSSSFTTASWPPSEANISDVRPTWTPRYCTSTIPNSYANLKKGRFVVGEMKYIQEGFHKQGRKLNWLWFVSVSLSVSQFSNSRI